MIHSINELQKEYVRMWLQKKLHCSSYFSIWIFLVLFIFFVLISVFAFTFVLDQKSSFSYSWKSFGFFNSNSSSQLSKRQQPSYVNGFSKEQRKENDRLERIEVILAKSRFSIKEAAKKTYNSTFKHEFNDYFPQGHVYRNANAFMRSYEEMERVFKIYVYEEGEIPIFHDGPSGSIYSTEGNFIHQMEEGSLYRTKDPNEAHVFFMPFSVVAIVQYLYEDGSKDRDFIGKIVADYVEIISSRYPFWNSSLGFDHVMLSCHDWGPYSTKSVPQLFTNSIRVLCNANTSEGYNPHIDASLPEINLNTNNITELLGGSPPSQRSILAFFAGRLHGHIRHLLLHQWKEKDPDMKIYEKLPKNVSYESMLRKSRFCICPSGYEVASPRIVEAIYAECVPVLISDGYVLPFSDVLDWNKFSVVVRVEDIGNLKEILMGIDEDEYLKMYESVRQVQRHFVVNEVPKRFDLFHMIVHSIWLRRLNMRIHN